MKTLKRAAAGLLALLLPILFLLPVQAAQGARYALYTDIVAQIDGHPIRSYNVDGRTAVVAEDLRGYGFEVGWIAGKRIVTVRRAPGADGGPLTPDRWPAYTPAPLTHPVGSRAKRILSTDIVTYVAGSRVDSFNIDGETLIWFDDLAPYGAVTWDPARRVISLTLGDPLAIRLNALISAVEAWKETAGANSLYTLYEGKDGTLFTADWSGTPHGGSYQMVYVDRLGNAADIPELLHGVGLSSYAQPRNIRIEDSGDITFDAPLRETLDGATGAYRDLGDAYCTVHVQTGRVDYVPLAGEVSRWSGQYRSGEWMEDPDVLEATVGRIQGSGRVENLDAVRLPGGPGDILLCLDQDSVYLNIRDGFIQDSGNSGGFQRSCAALQDLGLPSVTREDFSPVNSPELRQAAARYFRVELNGQAVPGNLWWGRGNGHSDLNFDFDRPVALSEGDVLTVWMGMPG